MHKPRHPFDGKPTTREQADEYGNPEFHVSARVLTPLRAKIADRLGEITACAGTAGAIIVGLNHEPSAAPLLCGAAIWLLHGAFEQGWRECLKRRADIAVTPTEFRFRSWRGWIGFDRALQHRIGFLPHDRAREERDQNELKIEKARQARKVVQPRRYHQESYHLSYELLGQRNDIIEIYGRPDAQAVVARLRAIEDVLNARAKRADGTPLKPGDQWVEQPGAIPKAPGIKERRHELGAGRHQARRGRSRSRPLPTPAI